MLLCVNCYLLCLLQLFLEMVPRFLGMSPLVDDSEVTTEVNGVRERRRSSFGLMQRAEEYVLKQPRSEMMFDKQRERHGLTRSIGKTSIFKTMTQLWPAITSQSDFWTHRFLCKYHVTKLFFCVVWIIWNIYSCIFLILATYLCITWVLYVI